MCQLGKNLYSIDIIKLITLESCWLLALALGSGFVALALG